MLFRNSQESEVIPRKFFWTAVFAAFVIVNAHPATIWNLLFVLLRLVPESMIVHLNAQDKDPYEISKAIASLVVFPIKEFLFFLCLSVLAAPFVRSIYRSRSSWSGPVLKKATLSALCFFAALSILTLPYSYPYGLNSHPSGLSGVGVAYARMSLAPFTEHFHLIFKRVLKPALAHFVQLDGFVLYYLFSLICTYCLIFLTLAFLESKTAGEKTTQFYCSGSKTKWFLYFSLMSSIFILGDFQWPGYSDDLSFMLVLLMAILPMTAQARLAGIALCLINHEGIALALAPVVLFCFPKKERITALAAMALYFATVAVGYGFDAEQAFQGQGTVVSTESVWQVAMERPAMFLAGLFFSFKLLWLTFPFALRILWKQKENMTLLAVVAMTLFPISLTFLAWDTTRVGGFGWFGMLIAIGILIKESPSRPITYRYAFLILMWVNVLIPTYNVVIFYQNSLSKYPYPGLYMLIDFAARRFLI